MSHYCLDCGSVLAMKIIEGRPREICPKCGRINYEQLKLAAGCCVEKDEKILLIQRRNDPYKGCWHMPQGFVEVEEHPLKAAERETLEESGLVVQASKLMNAYFFDDDPRGNGVVLIYQAIPIGGEIQITPETMGADYFSLEDLSRIPLAGVTGELPVQDWIRMRKNHD